MEQTSYLSRCIPCLVINKLGPDWGLNDFHFLTQQTQSSQFITLQTASAGKCLSTYMCAITCVRNDLVGNSLADTLYLMFWWSYDRLIIIVEIQYLGRRSLFWKAALCSISQADSRCIHFCWDTVCSPYNGPQVWTTVLLWLKWRHTSHRQQSKRMLYCSEIDCIYLIWCFDRINVCWEYCLKSIP